MVYLCSEGRFPWSRLDQLAGGREQEQVLVQEVRDLHHLHQVLGTQLEEVVGEVVLVVVDSVAGLFRGDQDIASKSKHEYSKALHRVGQALLGLALKHTLAVLAVNQVGHHRRPDIPLTRCLTSLTSWVSTGGERWWVPWARAGPPTPTPGCG